MGYKDELEKMKLELLSHQN